jgi:hypothetical protein
MAHLKERSGLVWFGLATKTGLGPVVRSVRSSLRGPDHRTRLDRHRKGEIR